MTNLVIPVMLLIVLAGVLAFLIYSLLSYRKRNILKFLILILVCLFSYEIVVSGQNESFTEPMQEFSSSDDSIFESEPLSENDITIFEQEPTFTSPNYPGPIIIPDLDKACNIIEVTIISGLGNIDQSPLDERRLEDIWNQTLLALNNNSSLRNGNLTFIA